MGTVFRKTVTKSLPPAAELFVRKGKRFARWRDAKGKLRTAAVTTGKNGQDRIAVIARTFIAQYRDGNGHVRLVATGCRDEQAARSILADLERRAVRVKAKLLTADEDAVADHQALPLAVHFTAYLIGLDAQGTSPVHRQNVTRCLKRVAGDCRFVTLADLNGDALEGWLVARGKDAKSRMSARTRNCYRGAWVAFCNWCIETHRLTSNPFAKVAKADEDVDRRRKRRAMTEVELVKLLDVARRRPLLEAMTVRRGKHKGQAVAKVRPEVVEQLQRLGVERCLIYKTLVLTGLRKNELASLTVGQLHLDGPRPFAELKAACEKNREGSLIPLRADLAAELREWLTVNAAALQKAASEAPTVRFDANAVQGQERDTDDSESRRGQTCLRLTGVPQLPADMPLFNVPRALVRILDRDLVAAGIARRVQVAPGKWKIDKRDERGRTIDVHALRHTFGTLLSTGGVAPRVAQAAMRHGDINLTMTTYTDPKLLDVHGALDVLPALPLDGRHDERQEATGTFDDRPNTAQTAPRQFALKFALTSDKPCTTQPIAVKTAGDKKGRGKRSDVAVSGDAAKRKQPPTTAVHGCSRERAKGLEPSTSSLGS
jgi:integrase